MRAALENQHHWQAGRPVHRANPPSLAEPDVRVVRRVAGDALGRILAAARRFNRDGWSEVFDAQIALERERGPAGEVWQGGCVVGHDADLSAGQGPLSRLNFADDGQSAEGLADHLRRSKSITICGRHNTAEVIHKSYPQAASFHVKDDVERLQALWIHAWTTASQRRRVSRETAQPASSTAQHTACG